MLKSQSWKTHHLPYLQGVFNLQEKKKIKHIIGEVFILTHKIFNLQFEEEIKILATLNQLFCERHILWQA